MLQKYDFKDLRKWKAFEYFGHFHKNFMSKETGPPFSPTHPVFLKKYFLLTLPPLLLNFRK